MANIDTSTIEGFDGMTADEKVTALLGLQIPDPVDLSGYVKKDVFDAKATEAASLAKQLKTKTTEAETAAGTLSTTQAELEALKRSYYVASKGLTGDEAEFIAFKAGKMVSDKVTFEQAVDELTADRKKTTFDWTAPVGGGKPKTGENDVMNALIRGALK
jgi:hypothetical protein|nr:MAG TPA: hypothetical protein [Caudoviricetes sp.]